MEESAFDNQRSLWGVTLTGVAGDFGSASHSCSTRLLDISPDKKQEVKKIGSEKSLIFIFLTSYF
jgi:hypothetical protein